MKIKDLIPFNWKREKPVKVENVPATSTSMMTPFDRIYDDLERVFRDPFFEVGVQRFWDREGIAPKVDVSETKKEIQIDTELPGMDEKDINVTIEKGQLILRGEKRQEKKEEKDKIHHIESSYGFFERVVPLPEYARADEAKATYKKGVLQIRIPKDPNKEQTKSVPIAVD